MAEDLRNGCDGHCERCNQTQRSYCAAQLAYYNMQEIVAIRADLARLNQEEVLTIVGANAEAKEAPKNDSKDKEE